MVTRLGKAVGHKQMHPLQAKVSALPETRCMLKLFLGMVGGYQAFCKNFSSVLCPLTDLLSVSCDFLYTECQAAFQSVKILLAI